MNLRIEIPFDENIFVKQSMLKWALTNNKTMRNIKSALIGWAIVFVLGVSLGIEKKQYVNILTIISTLILVYEFLLLIVLVRRRNKFRKDISKIAADLKAKNDKSNFEFTDQHFRYADNQMEIKLNWEEFCSYSEKENNLFLNQTDSFEYSHVFGQSELTKENYDALKKFLVIDLKLKEKEV